MEARHGPIRSVVVAGGGIVGWSAAAALRRKLPALAVTVIAGASPPDALADRIGSTLPSIAGFHADLGIGEGDAVVRAGSGFRLGTRFEAWAEGLPPYIHAYGEHGRAFGTASFHVHWLRAALGGGAAPFDSHAPAAAIAAAGRFVHPQGDPASPLSRFDYGLELDPPRYRAMMRAFALHVGAVEHAGTIAGVRLAADGFVDAVQMADGGAIGADLFVDCTGPAGLVRSALDDAFEDWGRWLPCDRILRADAPPDPGLPVLDRAAAMRAGWIWTAPAPAQTGHGIVYSSAHLGDDEAVEALRGATGTDPVEAPVSLRAGRRPEPWLRNCVAIGDAAIAVEPLEWTNLHLAHSAIDRLVAMMPARDCAPVEIADFNRQSGAEGARVRDFLALHYAAARREEPFWRDVARAEPPASLQHSLSLFRERGRLPFYEEETFARDSWLAVLIGQGVIPRRADPLIDSVPPAESDRAMAEYRRAIGTVVQTLPTHAAYLAMLRSKLAR